MTFERKSLVVIFIAFFCITFFALIFFFFNSFGFLMPRVRQIRESAKLFNKAVDTHKKSDFLFSNILQNVNFDQKNSSSESDDGKIDGKSKKASWGNILGKLREQQGEQLQQHNNTSTSSSLSFHILDIDAAAVKKPHSSICPLPILHPEKFQPIMHWGERKKFPSCKLSRGNFSRIERRYIDSQHHQEIVVVVVDSKKCPPGKEQLKVYEFDEMSNTEFRRMASVFDAEQRQNQLRDKFRNVHEFAKRVVEEQVSNKDSNNNNNHNGMKEFRLSKPYAVVECGKDQAVHVSAPEKVHDKKNSKKQHTKKIIKPSPSGEIPSAESLRFKNFLHFMWDSTSLYAFRRGAKRMKKFLEKLNNDPDSPSHVFAFKHIQSVSCCSPGNQIPFYSGNINGEGDFFVNAEPFPDSRDWIWNIARDELGFKTFWSLDNCPDKSARDYHAFPSVDTRVVAPICLAGVLLSHKEKSCLGGKSVDEHVLDGLTDFWTNAKNQKQKKFAAIQMISPHEETEKQLIEVDDLVASWFESEAVFTRKELEDTVIVLWSDHGINFGKYASSHDGEIEKIFPFCFIIAPRKSTPARIVENLRSFEDRLVTPYDIFETTRSLMFLKKNDDEDGVSAPPFVHDPSNPPLPRPEESHIMASFQRQIIPHDLTSSKAIDLSRTNDKNTKQKEDKQSSLFQQHHYYSQFDDRSCEDANIPVEFCSCISWDEYDFGKKQKTKNSGGNSNNKFFEYLVREILIKEHKKLIAEFEDRCEPVEFSEIVSVFAQIWPLDYKPPSKETAKRVWMKPNRDFLKVTYKTKSTSSAKEGGVYVGVVSISQGLFERNNSKHDKGEKGVKPTSKFLAEVSSSEAKIHAAILDVVRLDRMDAMKKQCGIAQKVPEQLCICK